uniref:Uncharacterized protein n=1 Tax=Meloidogyne incognita TaxID=6306 RepID=A0A914NFV7_MELIC
MNFFLLFTFLLINFCYFTNGEKATIEQCDTVMDADYKADCKCLTDFPTCIKSLLAEGKCTKENYPSSNFIEKPCSNVYSKCSAAKNGCETGICACFDSIVDCLFKNTCQPIQKLTGSSAAVKRVRASDTAFGFNNLFDAHFEKIE